MPILRLCQLLVVILALSLGAGSASADFVGGLDPHGDNFLALRSGPGTTYRILQRLGPDTVVTVVGRRGDWLRIELDDGTKGWAFGKYILAGDPPGYDEPEASDAEEDAETETPAIPVVAEDWTGYVNDRFGTAIDYPASLFEMLPPPDSDDGRSFEVRGGEGGFFVFASHNVFEWTLPELLEDDLASGDYGSVTYRRTGDDWYALSGYRGDQIFYRKVILAGEVIHFFEATYPKAQRKRFDPAIARMAKSFSPGLAVDLAEPAPQEEQALDGDEPAQVDVAIETPEPVKPAIAADGWRAPLDEVLFDGRQTDLFLPHQAHGGIFDQHASYQDGALVVRVPPNNGWGKVGLLTSEPVVWLDAFHDDAEVRVEFTFDPERTSGFGLSLAEPGWGRVMGNDPGPPSVRYYWIRKADGSAARSEFHVDPHGTDDYDKVALPPNAPTSATFVLRPGQVAVELDGVEVASRPWRIASDGTALRIYAFSHVDDVQLSAEMSLRSIRVRRAYPTETTVAVPAPGVEPLPVETLFDGAPTPIFEPAAVAGGDFDAFARYDGGALVVAVPSGNSWGKTGLISAEPLISLDPRGYQTPTRLTLELDPTRTLSVVVALSGEKLVEMWPAHRAWLSLNRLPDEPFYAFGVHASPYNDRTRKLPAEWVDTYWDGTLELDFSEGRACLRIPAGPGLCADVPVNVGYGSYATILAHAAVEDAQTAMVLKKVTRGLVTPPGMTAEDRWFFVDDEDFDPGQFLNDLGSALQ